jgi:hypothetical protein
MVANMNPQDLRLYNLAQVEEILKFKWIESEKAHRDLYPGRDGMNKAASDWIDKYAKLFREYWFSKN